MKKGMGFRWNRKTNAPVKFVALVFCEEFDGVNIPPQINSPSGFNPDEIKKTTKIPLGRLGAAWQAHRIG